MDFESYPQLSVRLRPCRSGRTSAQLRPIIGAVSGDRNAQQPLEAESGTPPAATDRLRADGLTRPRIDRLDPADPDYGPAMEAHNTAVDAGLEGYVDPESGLFVMTAYYLAERGWCCGRGCRHCPYEDGVSIR